MRRSILSYSPFLLDGSFAKYWSPPRRVFKPRRRGVQTEHRILMDPRYRFQPIVEPPTSFETDCHPGGKQSAESALRKERGSAGGRTVLMDLKHGSDLSAETHV